MRSDCEYCHGNGCFGGCPNEIFDNDDQPPTNEEMIKGIVITFLIVGAILLISIAVTNYKPHAIKNTGPATETQSGIVRK